MKLNEQRESQVNGELMRQIFLRIKGIKIRKWSCFLVRAWDSQKYHTELPDV